MSELLERLRHVLYDRYHIERELGAGGMATVYLARDLKHNRHVALKVLHRELSASIGAERFLREIAVAAGLTHPHILPVHDSGAAEGLLFYVMPYVDGPSLRQRLALEGELPVADAVRILREVADAMSLAHRRGIVHRDLKPENVLLSGEHAIVADFGIAKALHLSGEGERLTATGMAIGTPSYMAPEQAAADAMTDHRADIYALGVLGYELLTGAPPFRGSPSRSWSPTSARPRARRVAASGNPAAHRRGGDALPGEAAGGPLAVGGRVSPRAGRRVAVDRARAGPGDGHGRRLPADHRGHLPEAGPHDLRPAHDRRPPPLPGQSGPVERAGPHDPELVGRGDRSGHSPARVAYRAVAPTLYGFERERDPRLLVGIADHIALLEPCSIT